MAIKRQTTARKISGPKTKPKMTGPTGPGKRQGKITPRMSGTMFKVGGKSC